jgi:hypothetical protein
MQSGLSEVRLYEVQINEDLLYFVSLHIRTGCLEFRIFSIWKNTISGGAPCSHKCWPNPVKILAIEHDSYANELKINKLRNKKEISVNLEEMVTNY